MFELNDALIGEVDLEGYEIRFRDSHGLESSLNRDAPDGSRQLPTMVARRAFAPHFPP